MQKRHSIETVFFDEEPYLCIEKVDQMDPFFMSIVGDSDFWLFAGSNGPFTAGRSEPDHGLFPYETVDRILRHEDSAGAMTIIRVPVEQGVECWAPWSTRKAPDGVVRNLYKHVYGTDLIFEEVHNRLGLVFRSRISTSQQWGLIRRCELINQQDRPLKIELLDGFHRIQPPGVTQDLNANKSYLVEGYMRHETVGPESLSLFTLNAMITDQAKPSESLRAAAAWSLGRSGSVRLIGDRQVQAFREGQILASESEVRGVFGACLDAGAMSLSPGAPQEWWTVADTWLDHSRLLDIRQSLRDPEALCLQLQEAVKENRVGLMKRMASADALQVSADPGVAEHHFANVLFNVMRGGGFEDGYRFPKADLQAFIRSRNRRVADQLAPVFRDAEEICSRECLCRMVEQQADPDVRRLLSEYLPLTFSRRHGDPSRPWNTFRIRIRDREGEPIYDYQGNWRDLFQNWESLGLSYPCWLDAMIRVFLNASTADGYNPYRVMRDRVEWELLDPEDPWSNIGYWGDHQIIYQLKLLEALEQTDPGRLSSALRDEEFVFVQVPYEIVSFDTLCRDPKNSITMREDEHERLMASLADLGGDGLLLSDRSGQLVRVNLMAKLLIPFLTKLANLVPDGGIWLNTQRPEWNDANNALAGWGLSMVTTAYLCRWCDFFLRVCAPDAPVALPDALADWIQETSKTLTTLPQRSVSAADRFLFMRSMAATADRYRERVYARDLGPSQDIPAEDIITLVRRGGALLNQTLQHNRREDGLFHSYNLLRIEGGQAHVDTLYPMLEGQVAALSSGKVSGADALELLDSLRKSSIYREDQRSYMLYPNRVLQPFLERNKLPSDALTRAPLLATLLEWGDRSLVLEDGEGTLHFQADFRNADDLQAALDRLSQNASLAGDVETNRKAVLELWEEIFHHRAFTGRSGTFFAFEGLGSIYWHMVSKLMLAVQECWRSEDDPALRERLAAAYLEIREGLGYRKSAVEYGGFPTDPYSHTPAHRRAQQPGMTGQVKEEILTRWGELGLEIRGGRIGLNPRLLQKTEFSDQPSTFSYPGPDGQMRFVDVPEQALAFTYCQIPIVYRLGDQAVCDVTLSDGTHVQESAWLSVQTSDRIFRRNDEVRSMIVYIPLSQIRDY